VQVQRLRERCNDEKDGLIRRSSSGIDGQSTLPLRGETLTKKMKKEDIFGSGERKGDEGLRPFRDTMPPNPKKEGTGKIRGLYLLPKTERKKIRMEGRDCSRRGKGSAVFQIWMQQNKEEAVRFNNRVF